MASREVADKLKSEGGVSQATLDEFFKTLQRSVLLDDDDCVYRNHRAAPELARR